MNTVYHKSKELQLAADEYWDWYEGAAREERHVIVSLYNPVTKSFFPGSSQKLENDYWRRDTAKRYADQIEAEGITTWQYVALAGWRSYRRILREDAVAFKGIPIPPVMIVISERGNRELGSREETVYLLDEWLKQKPKNMHTVNSPKFGKDHAGSRPPSKGCVKVYKSLRTIEKVLTEDDVAHRNNYYVNIVLTDIDQKDALEYVENKLVTP